MKTPGFWYRKYSLLSWLLAPLGQIYGAITVRRMRRPGARPPVPVVCVGNFVMGGAGKTPAAIAIGRIAKEAGLDPYFLTRGYGGRRKGPLLVDPVLHSARDVGDEALLLAAVAPTVLSANRMKGLKLIAASGGGIAIMDDGLQNPAVAKTLSIAVVDAAVGVGVGRCFPAGPLRAPVHRQLPQVDVMMQVGDGPAVVDLVRIMARAGKPVLRSDIRQYGLEDLRGQRLLAYCGIGRPAKFINALKNAGLEVVASRSFADHHHYSGLEAAELVRQAETLGARLVTTPKDAVRLSGSGPGPKAELLSRSVVMDMDLVPESPDFILSLLEAARREWQRGA